MTAEHAQEAPSTPKAEQTDAPRLRLRSLKVHQFRDVRPGTELRFGDGFHLILGKNGSGKSTLLELLAAVSTLDFGRPFFDETPFHLEASLEIGEVSLHAEIRREFEAPQVPETGSALRLLWGRDEAEVTVRIEHPELSFHRWVRVRTGEDLQIFTEDPKRGGEGKFPLHPASSKPIRISNPLAFSVYAALYYATGRWLDERPWLEESHVPSPIRPALKRASDYPRTGAPFDEALSTLGSMTGDEFAVECGESFFVPSPWLFAPLDLHAQGEPIELELSKHPLLKRAIEALGFDDAKAYFGPGASTKMGWRYSAPSFQFYRNGKAMRRHDQLSFGQKRLFSFAWYLACNPDIAIADELVNGLHSDWIDWCVDTLRDRQSFLSSQNPILVDTVPFNSKEEIERGIILCESVHDAESDTNELRWRQLESRESELIARALEQSRLDLLSDLLHALDLW